MSPRPAAAEAAAATKGRPTNNLRIWVGCLKPSRLGMSAASMPTLEGLRHPTPPRNMEVIYCPALRAGPHDFLPSSRRLASASMGLSSWTKSWTSSNCR